MWAASFCQCMLGAVGCVDIDGAWGLGAMIISIAKRLVGVLARTQRCLVGRAQKSAWWCACPAWRQRPPAVLHMVFQLAFAQEGGVCSGAISFCGEVSLQSHKGYQQTMMVPSASITAEVLMLTQHTHTTYQSLVVPSMFHHHVRLWW